MIKIYPEIDEETAIGYNAKVAAIQKELLNLEIVDVIIDIDKETMEMKLSDGTILYVSSTEIINYAYKGRMI